MRRGSVGFTLTEVLIALVIVAVLAALAIPAYRNTMEQARSNEAITNLNVVHMAEKIRRLNTGSYAAGADIATLNATLSTDMASTFFTGAVTIAGVSPNDSYTATMTRNNVSGGNGTDYYRYVYTNNTAAPICTKTGAVAC